MSRPEVEVYEHFLPSETVFLETAYLPEKLTPATATDAATASGEQKQAPKDN